MLLAVLAAMWYAVISQRNSTAYLLMFFLASLILVSAIHAHFALTSLEVHVGRIEPVFAGDVRRREDLLSATITVARAVEIERLFLGYQAAGVAFQQSLRTEVWGAQTFVVSDPDGNRILFAGPDAD